MLKAGRTVFNATKGKSERIGRLLKMHANKREEIKEVYAGDIAAAVGLKSVTTGDTICDEKQPVVLEAMDFPAPVISLAIEPKTKADQEKLGQGLAKLMPEDPTFRVETDQETGQTMISGHGRAAPRDHRRPPEARVQRRGQRRQAAGRLQGDDHAARPRARARYIKQTGGRGQYGHAKIELSPRGRARASCSSTRSSAAAIPQGVHQADRGGHQGGARRRGVLAGYPVVDVGVELYDGCYHDVDSNEMAFKIAGSMAFKDAAQKAKPVLLEPVMRVEVVMPEEYMGDDHRRPQQPARPHPVDGCARRHADHQRATVPLSEMFGYATELRSRTQGRATYSMHFDRYEQAPNHISDEVVKGK